MPHQSDADPKLRPKWSPNSKRKREREREREREEALGLWRLKNEAMVISGITCYTLIRGQPGLIKGIWTAYQGRVSPEYHLSSACLQRAHRKTCGRKAVGERASQTNAYRCYHCAQMLKYNVCHSRRPLSLSLSLLLFIFSLFLSFFLSILCLCLSIFFCFLLSVFIVVVLDWNDLIPIPVWEMFMICIVFVSSRSSDWRCKSICVCWFDWFKCIATTNLLLEKKRETKLENDARRMENGSGGGREGREGGEDE